ncbi:MAG: hypothetical protein O2894_00680 [Planctomycetota bacterium]|nr:hypothetical protein [Planctomycetota bacterium]
MSRTLALMLCLCVGATASADPPDPAPIVVDAAHVTEALAAAGENAPELQRVLEHFALDQAKQVAARFLIANMPGKGYVRTRLVDAQGAAVAFDPLAYDSFESAREAIEALETEHGALDFQRSDLVEDVRTIRADALIRHIDLSFAAWLARPPNRRVSFGAFLEYVLPYRGSEEPLDDWLAPLQRRYAPRARQHAGGEALDELYAWLLKDIGARVRFDPRYYLHPTDQGYTEMGRTGLGRCEDITNMQTYAARSLALATAADYTPYWAHGDNNHAWNVLLDNEGRGAVTAYSHAAKVYRKSYAIQRDSLAFQLADGREAPNRFMGSTTARDVTDQYGPTTDVTVEVGAAAGAERHAYLCVFNGGEWRAIHWGTITAGRVTFDRMGRNIVYLPAVHDGTRLIAVSAPLLVHRDGQIEPLPGVGTEGPAVLRAVQPQRRSVDTGEDQPITYLLPEQTYTLQVWDVTKGAWSELATHVAGAEPWNLPDLRRDALYWLVAKESRRLERPFTIAPSRDQKWW